MSSAVWRSLGITLLGLGLAILLAAVAWVAWSRTGTEGTSQLPYVPLAVDKSLGINADLSRLDPATRQESLTAMQKTGFHWLRQRFPWDAIEPEQGVHEWEVWDGIIKDAARHNLPVIAVLDGSPDWARVEGDAGNPLAPPAENRAFGDFAETLARRYGDWIDHYQIWDEPNIAPHWGAREIDPQAYGRLLRDAAMRIRAADPGAVILAAALAPNVEPGGANMSDLVFLDELYQGGSAEWFDVVAVQPYDLEGSIDAPADVARLTYQRPALVRQVMEAHGDVETAVWAVSFGLKEGTPGTVTRAVEQVRVNWPWLGPMLWAAWSPQDPHGQYTLTDVEGRPGSICGALHSLANTAVLAWPGVYPADHASGQYVGDWRVTPSGADIGVSGDRLRIPFRGTRLDLTVRRGDYRAFLFASVDGEPANALPRDVGGRAYLVLYDPLQQIDTITIADNLPDIGHVAEIIAERGWGQWAIVGWAISRDLPGASSWLPLGLGLVACLVLGLTVYIAWPRRSLLCGSVSILVARYRVLDDRLALLITAAAAGLLYVMTGTFPTLAALALIALLLLLRPEMGLPLIALTLPFYQLGRPLLGKVFSMVEILTLLTATGWFVHKVLRIAAAGKGPSGWRTTAARNGSGPMHRAAWVSRWTALDWGVLALVIVSTLSLLWTEHLHVAARELRTVVFEASLFYALLRALVPAWRTETQKERCLWLVADAWILGGALIALVGLYQWAFGQNLIAAEGMWRVRGFYGSPNNLALYLGKVLPLTVALAIWGRIGQRRRWAYALAALLVAFVLFLTYSRGAWVLGVPASLLFLAAVRGRRALAVGVGLLLVLGLLLLLFVGTGRLTSLLDTTEGTTFFRLQLWQSSWAMISDHPLVGVGLDNFLYYYRTQYVLPTAWEEFNLSHPHNFVFDFWLRLGLPGLAVIIWLLIQFFRRGFHVYRHRPEDNERLLVLGLMAGMVNFVAHGLVDNAFFLVDLAFVFMLMLALTQAVKADGELRVAAVHPS